MLSYLISLASCLLRVRLFCRNAVIVAVKQRNKAVHMI